MEFTRGIPGTVAIPEVNGKSLMEVVGLLMSNTRKCKRSMRFFSKKQYETGRYKLIKLVLIDDVRWNRVYPSCRGMAS